MKTDGKFHALSVVGVLLTFVSGSFSLSRLNIPEFQVKYVLFAVSVTILLAFLTHNSNTIKFSRSAKKFLFLLSAYVLYAIISLFWLNDITVGIPKFIDVMFLFFILLGLSVAIHTFKDRDRLSVIVAYFFVIVGLVYSSQIVITGLAPDSFRSEVYSGGYNIQTRLLFMAACSSLFLSARSGEWKYIAFLCLFLLSIILLASKQGIIAAILVLMLFFLLKMSSRYKSGIHWKKRISKMVIAKRLLTTVAVISVAGWFFYDKIYRIFIITNVYFHKFYLWDIFTNEEFYMLSEKGTRARLFVNSIESIKEHPGFGIGLAGYLDVPNIGFYPHNIVLEFLLDGGILGGVFFLIFATYSIYIVIIARKSVFLPISLIPLYMLIVSSVSGDLYHFRYYFMWVVISLYLLSGRVVSTHRMPAGVFTRLLRRLLVG